MQNLISFLMVLIFFENFEKFSYGAFYHLSKMFLQGTFGVWTADEGEGECKMQNLISFFMVLIIYQKCPFKEHLFLAGYAQSSVPGVVNPNKNQRKI